MMQRMVDIKAHDGGTFRAYTVYPGAEFANSGPRPAVVVIQEIFGINSVMRGICQTLAEMGYIAICPDLFWRQEPGITLTDQTEEEWAKAFELYKGFDTDLGVEDLKATLAHVRQDPKCNGRAGSMGFCLGGKLAYLMATRSDSDCNVGYYGVEIDTLLGEAGNIKTPLMLHIAEKDKFVPPEAQARILSGLQGKAHVTLHVYPGMDHAFARHGGEHYNAEAAHQANDRTAEFFAANLLRRKQG